MTTIEQAASCAAEWSVGVVIPARDEAARVGRCIATVRAALDQTQARASWILVVADRCVDDTAGIAREVLEDAGAVLPCRAGSVGRARRLGVEAIFGRFDDVPPARLWLLATDADSEVPVDWVTCQLGAASAGAAAVAGVVRVDSFAEHPPWAARRFDETYELRADGTHPHVHGANLGVRGDAYRAAGGWRDQTVAEDHCLWGRIGAAGYPRVALAASYVVTSGRARGRAPGGFADTLRRVCESAA